MKVCVICFDFKKENLRRQPWRYIYEISKGLNEKNIDLVVITDTNSDMVDNIRVRNVKKLNSIFSQNEEVLDIINEENPDIIIMNMGLTSFLRSNFKIKQPIIGILTSPIYSPQEVLNIGSYEFLKHFNHVIIHLVGSLMPNFLIKRYLNDLDLVVTLSESNRKILERIGVQTEIIKIVPGIDEFYRELPDKNKVKKIRESVNPENLPLIMYYTSPLTLRGTDNLVKAFKRVIKEFPCKLIILSRREHKELSEEEKLLKNIAKNEGILDSMEIIPKYLNPEGVKEYVSTADIICLPFKIVISDIPISILESMALGKPVISTNIGCIPELLNSKLLVNQNDPNDIANTILKLLNDEKLVKELGNESRKYMENYPTWNEVKERFFKTIQGFNNE